MMYGNEKRPTRPTGPRSSLFPGLLASAVIILLTDGQRTTGPDSIQAAKMAAERGVRIYTAASARPEGKIIGFEAGDARAAGGRDVKAVVRHHARRILLRRQRRGT